jgi:hypothetical protein
MKCFKRLKDWLPQVLKEFFHIFWQTEDKNTLNTLVFVKYVFDALLDNGQVR